MYRYFERVHLETIFLFFRFIDMLFGRFNAFFSLKYYSI
jgi:hypothetical protein